ncbi:acyl carrier protein [Spirosoma flavum]|uniref:Acyl carrier protein n=1 Tax=Spirosoma flavum TaxID=2048557 RepID=A0ABW6AQP6_9BACT
MEAPTFEQLADFVRQATGCSRNKIISPLTQFENDLGVTGDDGVELLEAVEKHFGIPLTNAEGQLCASFGLKSGEYLFHSEGWSLPLWWFGWGQKPIIHNFTVGELHAVLQAQSKV